MTYSKFSKISKPNCHHCLRSPRSSALPADNNKTSQLTHHHSGPYLGRFKPLISLHPYDNPRTKPPAIYSLPNPDHSCQTNGKPTPTSSSFDFPTTSALAPFVLCVHCSDAHPGTFDITPETCLLTCRICHYTIQNTQTALLQAAALKSCAQKLALSLTNMDCEPDPGQLTIGQAAQMEHDLVERIYEDTSQTFLDEFRGSIAEQNKRISQQNKRLSEMSQAFQCQIASINERISTQGTSITKLMEQTNKLDTILDLLQDRNQVQRPTCPPQLQVTTNENYPPLPTPRRHTNTIRPHRSWEELPEMPLGINVIKSPLEATYIVTRKDASIAEIRRIIRIDILKNNLRAIRDFSLHAFNTFEIVHERDERENVREKLRAKQITCLPRHYDPTTLPPTYPEPTPGLLEIHHKRLLNRWRKDVSRCGRLVKPFFMEQLKKMEIFMQTKEQQLNLRLNSPDPTGSTPPANAVHTSNTSQCIPIIPPPSTPPSVLPNHTQPSARVSILPSATPTPNPPRSNPTVHQRRSPRLNPTSNMEDGSITPGPS